MNTREKLNTFSVGVIEKCSASERARACAIMVRHGRTISDAAAALNIRPSAARSDVLRVIEQCGFPFPEMSSRANQAAIRLGSTSIDDLKSDIVALYRAPNIGDKTIQEILGA